MVCHCRGERRCSVGSTPPVLRGAETGKNCGSCEVPGDRPATQPGGVHGVQPGAQTVRSGHLGGISDELLNLLNQRNMRPWSWPTGPSPTAIIQERGDLCARRARLWRLFRHRANDTISAEMLKLLLIKGDSWPAPPPRRSSSAGSSGKPWPASSTPPLFNGLKGSNCSPSTAKWRWCPT